MAMTRRWLFGFGIVLLAGGCGGWFEGGRGERGTARARAERERPEKERRADRQASTDEAWEQGRDPAGRRRRVGDMLEGSEVEALAALGYVAEGADAGDGPTGVLRHDAAKAYPGTNLVVSAHAYEVSLLDMDGRERHRWVPDRSQLPIDAKVNGFRKAELLPGGELLGVIEGKGLVRLSKDGTIVWRSDLNHHHDLHREPDGTLHTLAREVRTIKPFRDRPTVEDLIVVFAPDGTVEKEISILKALARSPYTALLDEARAAPVDALHTNSLELLDGRAATRNAAFAKGRYLLSCRTISAVLVLDPETETVVWAQQGPWRHQHDPTVLDDGHVMVFDNHTPGPSAVVVFDPANGQLVHTWEGPAKARFYTACCGTAQPLPNGNTLVVVTDDGRAVEIDEDEQPVWLYQSPHTVARGRKVARLFDVVRTPPVSKLPWLAATAR